MATRQGGAAKVRRRAPTFAELSLPNDRPLSDIDILHWLSNPREPTVPEAFEIMREAGRRHLDARTRARYVQEVATRLGWPVDDPLTVFMASPLRWEIVKEIQAVTELLETQRVARQRLLAKLHVRPELFSKLDAATVEIVAGMEDEMAEDRRYAAAPRASRGPRAEVGMAVTAKELATFTARRTANQLPDWQCVAMIMSCHGWNLGRIALRYQARRSAKPRPSSSPRPRRARVSRANVETRTRLIPSAPPSTLNQRDSRASKVAWDGWWWG